MTVTPKRIYRSRSSSQEFLFSKPDTRCYKPGWQRPSVALPSPRQMKDTTFANSCLVRKEPFAESVLQRTRASDMFCAVALRIDTQNDANPCPNSQALLAIFSELAQHIDAMCGQINGIWGFCDANTLGCFAPDQPPDTALQAVKDVQKHFLAATGFSFSAGVAEFPQIDFEPRLVLQNACKALDHAQFCEPSSVVVFDAVSLNISGDKLYQNDDIEGAILEFKTALQLDPFNVNVHNSLGVCYGVLGQLAKAQEAFATSSRLDPKETMAIYNNGLVHLLQNNSKRALEHFLEAYSLDKDVFEIPFQIGKQHLEMGHHNEAAEFLEKAIQLNPMAAVAYRLLGQCHACAEREKDAIKAYKNAVKYNPNDAAALSALGCLFEKQGENLEIAALFCRQSIDIAPDVGLFHFRLGKLYYKQNQLDDALNAFNTAQNLGYDSNAYISKIQADQTAKAS